MSSLQRVDSVNTFITTYERVAVEILIGTGHNFVHDGIAFAKVS